MMSMFQIVIFRLLFALTLGLLPLDVFAHTGVGQTCGLTMKALRKEKLTRLIGIAITLSGVYLAAYA